MPAAAVAGMLTRVDVGAEAPTPALGKMAVAAILRDALSEDTAKDTDPLLLLLSVWSRIGID